MHGGCYAARREPYCARLRKRVIFEIMFIKDHRDGECLWKDDGGCFMSITVVVVGVIRFVHVILTMLCFLTAVLVVLADRHYGLDGG